MNDKNSNILKAAKNIELKQVSKKKQISFVGAILLVISSCIGSGIFFKSEKVYSDNWNSFILSIASWVIAAIAVICMAIALIEIASNKNNKNDNLSLIGWCKKFNSNFIYKCCKNFMFYVFVPLEFFYLPYYFTQSIQKAFVDNNGVSLLTFHTNADWAIWMVIGLGISSWLIFTSGLHNKMADIQNKIVIFLKFFPLAMVVIIGIVMASENGVDINPWPKASDNATSFYQIWPGFGTFLSLSAIFFAFDGFYFAAGIQKEMKEPKKTPKAIFLGLIIVTVIYLIIAMTMSIVSSTGKIDEYHDFLSKHNLNWIYSILNILIAISVFGTLNGFTTWATRLTEDLLLEKELPFYIKFSKQISEHKPIVGALYVYAIVVPTTTLFSIIGGLCYIPDSNMITINSISISPFDYKDFKSTSQLYSFADLMSNWTSIFAFTFIVCAIFGALRNRKTNKIEVEKNKLFIPTAIISIIIVSITLLITVIQPFADLFLLKNLKEKYTPEKALSAWMLVVTLFIFISFILVPLAIEKILSKKKDKNNIIKNI